MSNVNLFIDLDGVLADFVAGVRRFLPSFTDNTSGDGDKKQDRQMWKSIGWHQKNGGQLWLELPLMSDAQVLWDYVKKYDPQILSAAGNASFGAEAQKHKWVAKHFGTNVVVNIVEKAVLKAEFAAPGFILIDDKLKAINPWRAAGGTGVLHSSAADTIEQLKVLGL